MSGLYTQNFSPVRVPSPHIKTISDLDSGHHEYLTELLEERKKIGPFVQVLPICTRLLNQEILRVSRMMPQQGLSEMQILRRGSFSPLVSSEMVSNYRGVISKGWNGLPHEILGSQSMIVDWQAPPTSPSSYLVKKMLRFDIPVSTPNFNFVGRLIGPRGNSLKRVEAHTGCRVFIRGKGSIKDSEKEESLKGRPGYEHLTEPLHILIEAELPANIIDMRMRKAHEIIEELLKPVDELQDLYKRQQLRELAILNSSFREESPVPRPSGSVSPFTSSGMKRAKTGQ